VKQLRPFPKPVLRRRALSVPDVQSLDLTGPVAQNSYSTTSQMGGFPALDAAVGIWAGFPLAVTGWAGSMRW
jgi:hypothetical protein